MSLHLQLIVLLRVSPFMFLFARNTLSRGWTRACMQVLRMLREPDALPWEAPVATGRGKCQGQLHSALRIVRRCLRRDPAARPSAAVVLRRLNKVFDSLCAAFNCDMFEAPLQLPRDL